MQPGRRTYRRRHRQTRVVAKRAAGPVRIVCRSPAPRRAATNGNGDVGAPAQVVNGGITIGDRAPQLSAAPAVGDAGALGGRVTVRPVRAQAPPNVDGQLDDAIWQGAARVTEFVQRQPADGAPATEDTEVFLAYDSSQIYLAFHVKYQDLGVMRANRVDRDQTGRDDTIAAYFDPFLDQQRAYVFSVNGYGVQGDAIVGGGGGGGQWGGGGGGEAAGRDPRGDSSWDALFSTAGQPVEDGFTAEMAIPFKSLRYRHAEPTCLTRGVSRSSVRSGARRRPSSGHRSRATSPASSLRWVFSTA